MSKFKNHASLPVNFEGLINARQPQDVFTFFDDFMGCSWALDADSVAITSGTASAIWDYTAVVDDGGGLACADAGFAYKSVLGGVLRITTVGTVDTGHNLQVAGTQFLIDQDINLPLYFEARFRVEDVSNTDVFIGLSAVDTEIVNAGLVDGTGFLLEEGVLSVHSAESDAEKSTASGVTMADGTAASNAGWIRVAFFFDGKDSVSFFIDGNDDGTFDYITTLTVSSTLDYLPDDQALTPTIEMIVGATASAEVMDVDYVYCAQQRYHA